MSECCEVEDCYADATTTRQVRRVNRAGRTHGYQLVKVCDDHLDRDLTIKKLPNEVRSVVGGYETGKRR